MAQSKEQKKEYIRRWRAEIRTEEQHQSSIEQVGLRKLKNQNFVADIKHQFGCRECGADDPVILDWHHRNPDEKEYSVSNAIWQGLSRQRILIEILKCDCLCANCHRREHKKPKD
mgnify:CR=1 FL=1